MLSEILEQTENIKTGHFIPCPPVSDRETWGSLPGSERWLQAGNDILRLRPDKRTPALPLSLWMEYYENGNRSDFEHSYFMRRRNLCCLVMAECFEYHGRFLQSIADLLWAVMDESAWQLPAHNCYERDVPQLPLPDPSRPVIDLFAAETGALLSMTDFLLGDRLELFAPSISDRIHTMLEQRIIKPYLHEHFWWMGNGDEPMCNWTSWCTQNVLITVSHMHPGSSSVIGKTIKQAVYSLDCFLKDYGDDGCCSEGAEYYRHAALCFFNDLDILCRLYPGVFDQLWQNEKIRNIAEYISNMHVDGPYYMNFSDCSPMSGARGAREFLFGKKIGSTLLMDHAASDFVQNPDPDHLKSLDDSEGINLYYHIQTLFAENEIREYASHMGTSSVPAAASTVYRSNGLLICRTSAFTAGFKAGSNADSHNHNDTGSITVYRSGQPLLIDIGVESYTRKTFSPRRYEIWTMQSSWHNLPEFDPDGGRYMQLPGAEYSASDIHIQDDGMGLSMDIAPAYTAHGEVPLLSHYIRRVSLSEKEGLTIDDSTDFPGLIALTLMSVEKPVISDMMIYFGSLAYAVITNADRISADAVRIKDKRLLSAWPNILYRTRIYFRKKIRIEIE